MFYRIDRTSYGVFAQWKPIEAEHGGSSVFFFCNGFQMICAFFVWKDFHTPTAGIAESIWALEEKHAATSFLPLKSYCDLNFYNWNLTDHLADYV